MFGQTKNVGNITRHHPKRGFGHPLNIFAPLCCILTWRRQTGIRHNVSVHVTLLLGCLERLEYDRGNVVFQNLRINPDAITDQDVCDDAAVASLMSPRGR